MIVQVDYVVCYRTESCLRDKNSTVSANWLIHIPNFQWPQGILSDPLLGPKWYLSFKGIILTITFSRPRYIVVTPPSTAWFRDVLILVRTSHVSSCGCGPRSKSEIDHSVNSQLVLLQMSLLTRPTSRLPTYAEAVSAPAYIHEPFSVFLTPGRLIVDLRLWYLTHEVHGHPGNSRRRDPPVHDIGAGDRLVALIDINVRKAGILLENSHNWFWCNFPQVMRALLSKSRTVEMRVRSGASTESTL